MVDGNDIKTNAFARVAGAVPEPAKHDRSALGQDEFFNLMITQLKNQDPTNPVDSEQFLSQVAQFSTVSGIQSIEKSIRELAVSMESNQALQASTLVGREVLVPSATGVLRAGSGLNGAAELEQGASRLVVEVSTPAGQLVKRMELGAQEPGLASFTWEGIGEDGTGAGEGFYRVSAHATVDDQDVSVPVMMSALVDSVTVNRSPPGVMLNLEGIGQVSMNDVREFL